MTVISEDDKFKCSFLNKNDRIPIEFSLNLVPRSPIDNNLALPQVMATHWTCDHQLPEPMRTQLRDACMRHEREWVDSMTLQWRHNEPDCVSNHQPRDYLLNRLFRRRSKKTSKLRVTGLCVGNSPGTGEFPAQMTSNAENVSIWWRHHEFECLILFFTTLEWFPERDTWTHVLVIPRPNNKMKFVNGRLGMNK